MAPDPHYPNFDPVLFARVSKIAAAVNLFILCATIAALIFVVPDPAKCPGWRLPDASATPTWLLVGIFVGLPVMWSCFIAMHPGWFAHRIVQGLSQSEGRFPHPMVLFPVHSLIIAVSAGWTAFCILP